MKKFEFESGVPELCSPCRALPPISKNSKVSAGGCSKVDVEPTRFDSGGRPLKDRGLDIYGYPIGFLDLLVKITKGLSKAPAELVYLIPASEYQWMMDMTFMEAREYAIEVIEGRAF